VNPLTIAKDLDYLFNSLKTTFDAYVDAPSAANLKAFSDIYVQVMLVLENDSETKSLLQDALDIEKVGAKNFGNTLCLIRPVRIFFIKLICRKQTSRLTH
jgi:hypothetical protein